MWQYKISTGELSLNGVFRGTGYSGKDDGDNVPEPGEGKNDPTKVTERGIGPLPPGKYKIGLPHHHPTAGPVTMRLHPQPGTETFGRSGFLIHPDSINAPGTASHGCIVLSRLLRLAIADGGDEDLNVVP